MSPVHCLRAAAIVTLLMGAGHMSGCPWTPVGDAAGQRVIDAMSAYHFDAMGSSRSYQDFFTGFGWMLGAYLIAHAILFWQLAAMVAKNSAPLRALTAVLCVEYFVIAGLSWKFLFILPLGMTATIAVLLAVACISIGGPKHETPPRAAPN
jgi:hypothetical protein